MAENYDDNYDWDDALTSGFLEEYRGTIQNPHFGTDDEYNEGQTLRLQVDIRVDGHDDPDSDVDPGDVFTEAFNVGDVDTWEALDGGKRVGKVDGKPPKFNDRTGIGQLVKLARGKALQTEDGEVVMEGADELLPVLRERGHYTRADVWDGLQFSFRRLTFGFDQRETGERITYNRTYPVAFLGVEDEGKATKKASKSTAKDKVAAAKAKSKAKDNGDGPTEADLVEEAGNHDSFDEFLAAAMDKWPGVEDGDLAGPLLDEESGVYAQAHG